MSVLSALFNKIIMEKKKYIVNKFYGRFRQCWLIDSMSHKDAWNRAERDGVLLFQSVYNEYQNSEYEGFTFCLEKDYKMKPPFDDEYWIMLKESIENGMIATQAEYEKVYGLPFVDVWRN